MLYSLFMWLHQWKSVSFFQVVRYPSFRIVLSTITAMVCSLLIGPYFIDLFKKKQIGEQIREDGPKEHFKKSGTPTMGGSFILFSLFISTLFWMDLKNIYVWLVLLVTMGYGIIGFVDDYLKLTVSKKGLSGRLKLILQILIALATTAILFYSEIYDVTIRYRLMIPFVGADNEKIKLILHPLLYLAFGIFIIVGSSNAVNLTDGLDGLAIGPVIICSGTFIILTYVSGVHMGGFSIAKYLKIAEIKSIEEVSIFCAAMMGASIGFLWYNAYPAQVFMGDVGALALGGGLGTLALISKNELIWAVLGGIFVLEAISVILQVISFKLWRKRIFKMAPLHHHFELRGWAEPKIIVRFWIVSILLALVTLATLKIR